MSHERYALAREVLLQMICAPTLRVDHMQSGPQDLATVAWVISDAFLAEAERRQVKPATPEECRDLGEKIGGGK